MVAERRQPNDIISSAETVLRCGCPWSLILRSWSVLTAIADERVIVITLVLLMMTLNDDDDDDDDVEDDVGDYFAEVWQKNM